MKINLLVYNTQIHTEQDKEKRIRTSAAAETLAHEMGAPASPN